MAGEREEGGIEEIERRSRRREGHGEIGTIARRGGHTSTDIDNTFASSALCAIYMRVLMTKNMLVNKLTVCHERERQSSSVLVCLSVSDCIVVRTQDLLVCCQC